MLIWSYHWATTDCSSHVKAHTVLMNILGCLLLTWLPATCRPAPCLTWIQQLSFFSHQNTTNFVCIGLILCPNPASMPCQAWEKDSGLVAPLQPTLITPSPAYLRLDSSHAYQDDEAREPESSKIQGKGITIRACISSQFRRPGTLNIQNTAFQTQEANLCRNHADLCKNPKIHALREWWTVFTEL